MEGLAPIDGWAIAAIIAKAAGYGATLLAMGGPLFVLVLPGASAEVRQLARKVAVIAAVIGLAVLALRFGIRAARISGMGLSGAVDPMMLGFVWDSPLGTAAIWRGAGELLVVALLIRGIVGLSAGLIGALLIAVSYTFVGHSLGDPRWLLASLLTLHLLTAAFWIGALFPLSHAVGKPDGARLLHRFGSVAGLTVALLVVAGLILAWLMTGSLSGLLSTAYGWTLLAKLGVVTALMALAALNKWRFVPALASGVPTAVSHLRSSIQIEATAVLGPAQRVDVVIDGRIDGETRAGLLLDTGNGEWVEIVGFIHSGDTLASRGSDVLPLPAWRTLAAPDLSDPQRETLLMEGGAMRGMREARFGGETMGFRELAANGMVWAFNGAANEMDEPMFRATMGQTVQLEMTNRSMFPHAIHLHGHHFTVLSQSGAANMEGDVRDTVLIGADETVEIAFVADNPGQWMIHCHMLSHQKSGMMAWFEVA